MNPSLPFRFLVTVALFVTWAAPASAQNRWEPAIAAFEAADLATPPPAGAIVFVGSSSMRRWKTLAADFPEQAVVSRGFGGSLAADVVHYMDRIVLKYQPSVVVFYAGENDLARGTPPAEVAALFAQFCARLHEALPATSVIFVSIKPSPRREQLTAAIVQTNALVREFCDSDARRRYVDVYSPMVALGGVENAGLFDADRLHLSADGYAVWREALRPVLSELTGRPETTPTEATRSALR